MDVRLVAAALAGALAVCRRLRSDRRERRPGQGPATRHSSVRCVPWRRRQQHHSRQSRAGRSALRIRLQAAHELQGRDRKNSGAPQPRDERDRRELEPRRHGERRRIFRKSGGQAEARAQSGAREAGPIDLSRRHHGQRGVAACASCHGQNGAGVPAQFPRLGGQHAQYTADQLKAFRAGVRANDPNRMMRVLALKLTDREIDAVAQYIQGLR